jgi:hypothetical protein
MQLRSTLKSLASALLGVQIHVAGRQCRSSRAAATGGGVRAGIFGVDLYELAWPCPGERRLPGTMLFALLLLAGCWAIWRKRGGRHEPGLGES